MATKVYGASDDLIECEGDVSGGVGFYSKSDDDAALLVFSDGTLLRVNYNDSGVWEIRIVVSGTLLDRVETCDDEGDDHSDVAHFKDGLKFAYAATKWRKVA